MAQRNDKSHYPWLTGVTGVLAGMAKAQQDKRNYTLEEGIFHFAAGAVVGELFSYVEGEPLDTVNYTCYLYGQVVYVGITYKDRLQKRLAEHRKGGKKFNHFTSSPPRKRSVAEMHEKKKIAKYKPIYNVLHNW